MKAFIIATLLVLLNVILLKYIPRDPNESKVDKIIRDANVDSIDVIVSKLSKLLRKGK